MDSTGAHLSVGRKKTAWVLPTLHFRSHRSPRPSSDPTKHRTAARSGTPPPSPTSHGLLRPQVGAGADPDPAGESEIAAPHGGRGVGAVPAGHQGPRPRLARLPRRRLFAAGRALLHQAPRQGGKRPTGPPEPRAAVLSLCP
jgi:hypothetical protein